MRSKKSVHIFLSPGSWARKKIPAPVNSDQCFLLSAFALISWNVMVRTEFALTFHQTSILMSEIAVFALRSQLKEGEPIY